VRNFFTLCVNRILYLKLNSESERFIVFGLRSVHVSFGKLRSQGASNPILFHDEHPSMDIYRSCTLENQEILTIAFPYASLRRETSAVLPFGIASE
jgi:hypothetical protein